MPGDMDAHVYLSAALQGSAMLTLAASLLLCHSTYSVFDENFMWHCCKALCGTSARPCVVLMQASTLSPFVLYNAPNAWFVTQRQPLHHSCHVQDTASLIRPGTHQGPAMHAAIIFTLTLFIITAASARLLHAS